VLHGCARDDQPVKLTLGDGGLEVDVEAVEVVLRRALVGVATQADPDGVDLQDAAAQGVQQVHLVLLRLGHQVQDADPQGADVLPLGGRTGNDRDLLLFEERAGGMVVGYDDSHGQKIQRHAGRKKRFTR